MSIDRCLTCSRQVDSDEDTDCYDAEGQCFCGPCRDATFATARAEYLAERAAAEGARDIVDAGRGALLPEAWER